ncbi:hypothetical protein Pint_16154 [Pistacia integerrima]|uniref:Uncharacterized protein n=1 Tax=Pistacia integerrima TaxID=434235 RepID=A0ACC0Z8U3_9ROSI|nr:hypothetical protein Pint_16154 [Pistacia integerrima]
MFVEEPVRPNTATGSRALQQHLFSLLQSCNNIKSLTQIHTQIVICSFSHKNFILVKLLSLYITSSHLLNARKAFENIENPSTTVWNQIIRGHARSETPQKSVELYKQMVAKNEAEPDEFTYSFLLSACAKKSLFREGEQVHGRVLANGYCSNVFVKTNLVNLYAMKGGDSGVVEARKMFDEMSERNVVTWNSLLKAHLKCGDIDGARRVFDEMPQRNVVSWTTMISWCAHNGLCKQALSLFNEMGRARVGLDQVALVAALSACAELGDLKWHDVAAVRQKMIEMGVRKPPGRSRVQINGVVHDFVAGDSTHKHASLIYKMLDEITRQSMWEGYKLDVSELFSVVEE